MDTLHQQAAKLESGLQSWGIAQVTQMAGDPVEGVVSSALGIHTMSTAPRRRRAARRDHDA